MTLAKGFAVWAGFFVIAGVCLLALQALPDSAVVWGGFTAIAIALVVGLYLYCERRLDITLMNVGLIAVFALIIWSSRR